MLLYRNITCSLSRSFVYTIYTSMNSKPIILILILAIIFTMGYTNNADAQPASTTSVDQAQYADVNGLHLYYEIHGSGKPLVLLHGGGSTIGTTFGRILPLLAQHYKVIAVELQAHGRTKDNGRPLRFESDADDVAALLDQLHINKAAIFGFSNGATTALQIGIRHPKLVEKLVLASTIYKRSGAYDWLWEAIKHASLDNMPKELQDAYLKLTGDAKGLQIMHDRDAERMMQFKDIKEEDIRSINVPAFVISSDEDVAKPEHTVELYRLFPKGSHMAIFPGGHGQYLGEITFPEDKAVIAATAKMITEFLNAPVTEEKK